MEQPQSSPKNSTTNDFSYLLAIVGFIAGLLAVVGALQLSGYMSEILISPTEESSIFDQLTLLLTAGGPFVIMIIYLVMRLLAKNKKPTGHFMNSFFLGTFLGYLAYLGLALLGPLGA